MTMRSGASLVAVSLAFVVVAPPAAADASRGASPDPRASASASFREAQAAFARRDFAAAAAAFEQTARTSPHPATWLNAAEAWSLRGDWARAAEDCDRALEVPSTDEDLKREATRRLATALTHVGTLEVSGPRGFGVRVDNDPLVTVPTTRRLAVGAHRVVVIELATGRETIHEVSSEAGKVQAIAAPAVAPTSSPASSATTTTTTTTTTRSAPWGTWVSFGAGAALGVASGVLGYVTLDAKDDYEANPTRDTLETFRTDRLATNVTLGAALLAIAVGAALWVWAPGEATATSARRSGSDARFVGPWRLR